MAERPPGPDRGAGRLPGIAQLVAADLRSALGVAVEVAVVPAQTALAGARALVEKKLDKGWDLLVHGWFDLSLGGTARSGAPGVLRARRRIPGRAADPELRRPVRSDEGRARRRGARPDRGEIDRYCFDKALAVFLCAPQALYAVNNHVSFGPYRTTFEIAEVTVDEEHWSRRAGRRARTTRAAATE